MDQRFFRHACIPVHMQSDDRPQSCLPLNKAWRSPTDHIHQVGNDRIVAIASNYGHLQVRQDEGSPKFLNDYSPEHDRYGAGIGFLTEGDFLLSTYYSGTGNVAFDRILGIGYLRKRVKKLSYEIDQVIFAPFGDDPVLISQVTVSNHSNRVSEPSLGGVLGLPQLSVFLSFLDGSERRRFGRRCPPLASRLLRPILPSIPNREERCRFARNANVSWPCARKNRRPGKKFRLLSKPTQPGSTVGRFRLLWRARAWKISHLRRHFWFPSMRPRMAIRTNATKFFRGGIRSSSRDDGAPR